MVLRTRLLAAFGDRPIGRTTRLEVQSWVKALDDGILAASPCRKISLPPIVRSERFTLEPPHVQAIAAAVPDRFRALVLTAAATGFAGVSSSGYASRGSTCCAVKSTSWKLSSRCRMDSAPSDDPRRRSPAAA